MKVTKQYLKKIIKEELLKEAEEAQKDENDATLKEILTILAAANTTRHLIDRSLGADDIISEVRTHAKNMIGNKQEAYIEKIKTSNRIDPNYIPLQILEMATKTLELLDLIKEEVRNRYIFNLVKIEYGGGIDYNYESAKKYVQIKKAKYRNIISTKTPRNATSQWNIK